MSQITCPHCGETAEVRPDKAQLWGMFDNHTFKKYRASSPDDLVAQWRADLARDGEPALCPVRVYAGDRLLRTVGDMLHPDYTARRPKDEGAVAAFLAAIKADPDIARLMAEPQSN